MTRFLAAVLATAITTALAATPASALWTRTLSRSQYFLKVEGTSPNSTRVAFECNAAAAYDPEQTRIEKCSVYGPGVTDHGDCAFTAPGAFATIPCIGTIEFPVTDIESLLDEYSICNVVGVKWLLQPGASFNLIGPECTNGSPLAGGTPA